MDFPPFSPAATAERESVARAFIVQSGIDSVCLSVQSSGPWGQPLSISAQTADVVASGISRREAFDPFDRNLRFRNPYSKAEMSNCIKKDPAVLAESSMFSSEDLPLMSTAMAQDLETSCMPTLETIRSSIPLKVKYHRPDGSKDLVWNVVQELDESLDVEGRNVCFLCSTKAASEADATEEAWKRGIHDLPMVSHVRRHLRTHHEHTAALIDSIRKRDEVKTDPLESNAVLIDLLATASESPESANTNRPSTSEDEHNGAQEEPKSENAMPNDGEQRPSASSLVSDAVEFEGPQSSVTTLDETQLSDAQDTKVEQLAENSDIPREHSPAWDPDIDSMISNALAEELEMNDEPSLHSISKYIPPLVKHSKPDAKTHPVWEFIHFLDEPLKCDGNYNVCLVCSAKAAKKPGAPDDAWKNGLCNPKIVGNAMKHMENKHIHLASVVDTIHKRKKAAKDQHKMQLAVEKRKGTKRGQDGPTQDPAKKQRIVRSQSPRESEARDEESDQALLANGELRVVARATPSRDNESEAISQHQSSGVNEAFVRTYIKQAVEAYLTQVDSDQLNFDEVKQNVDAKAGSISDLIRSNEMSKALYKTCKALATWLDHLNEPDTHPSRLQVQDQSIESIMNVLALLPTASGPAQDVLQRCKPSSDSIAKLTQTVDEKVCLVNDSVANSFNQRSGALNEAIDVIVQASSAWTQRLVWFADTVARAQARDLDTKVKMQDILASNMELVSECSHQIEKEKGSETTKTQAKITLSKQIHEIVLERQTQMIRNGEPEEYAKLKAYQSVLESTEGVTTALRRKLERCDQDIQKNRAKIAMKTTALSFYESVIELLNCTGKRRQQVCEQLRKAQNESANQATSALSEYIPILTDASLKFYQSHSDLQKNARRDIERAEADLAELTSHYGDQAPSGKMKRLEEEKRAFEVIFANSKDTTLAVAEAQRGLWEKNYSLLPHTIQAMLVQEYANQLPRLSQPIREVVEKLLQSKTSENEQDCDAVAEEAMFGSMPQPESPIKSVETESASENIQAEEDSSEDVPNGILLRLKRLTGWR